MLYLLDTNVISEPVRPAPATNVVTWLRAARQQDLAISVLTIGEIAKGAALLAEGRRRDDLDRWLRADLPQQFAGRVLPVDDQVAIEWGRLSAEANRAGRPLPVIDGLLLATAAVRGLTLVTRNVRDCAERGVTLLNPWDIDPRDPR
jgi:toxin FitB